MPIAVDKKELQKANKVQAFFCNLISIKIQAMDKQEILSHIPVDILQNIKTKDPHPFFQAYSIAHEGESNPTVLGDTSKPIHWSRRAIQSIKNIITKGVKFFLGHNEDNSTIGRREIGEIITDFQKEIDGKLHHIVIGYHPQDVREEVKNYDICSQEANWNLIDKTTNFIAENIQELTGIALGTSKSDKPAFQNSGRLAMIQAFDNNNRSMNDQKGDIMSLQEISFRELIDEIKKRNTFPSQIYSLDEIKKDNTFLPHFSKWEGIEEKLNLLAKEKEELIKKEKKATVKSRLNKLIENSEVKLTDLQKKFIEKNFKEDKLDDFSDEFLKNFLNEQLENYKEYANIFNYKIDNPQNQQNQQGGEDSRNNNIDSNDYTKKVNNELLTEDIIE